MRDSNGKRRVPSWDEIAKNTEIYGWFTQLITKNKIILERGRQRIEIKQVPSTQKWKVEYYSGRIMDDTSGIEAERDAKIDAIEMAVLK